MVWEGFSGGIERSAGKESACTAGDPGSIPGWGNSPGEGTGYPVQCSCLENPRDRGVWCTAVYGVAQGRTQLAMWETWVQSLGWEDPSEKERATHFSILAWRIPWCPQPCSRPPLTHASTRDSWTLMGKSGSVSYGAHCSFLLGSLAAQTVKNLPAMQETQV